MREIKFRAWDEDLAQWVRHSSQVRIEVNNPRNYHLHENGMFVECEDIVLMQYTGLKDKNGVEIYEGDVVRLRDEWSNYYWIDKFKDDEETTPIGVVAIVPSGGVVCKFQRNRFIKGWEDNFSSGEKPLVGRWTMCSTKEKWEVIGNIYENPELLTKEKS